ncbi:50S ribosomal protein L30 [Deinococcus oregonensis]|uniref:Large ribosomal subunit protein uL30 n=2 Tax=Deinococcus TaxID=1298 RepID=A0A172TDT2_9DEIO|nr:50S ribosomal protein L30 [Deinococcus puniceus]THF71133.1 50S ribosomal protein L30 [Deinococcus sp. Arct2-2]
MKITLKSSVIGRRASQVATVKALGLRKIGDTRVLNDSPAIRGMVKTVQHMLEVEG